MEMKSPKSVRVGCSREGGREREKRKLIASKGAPEEEGEKEKRNW